MCRCVLLAQGFQLRRLGQGHGRKADFLAIARAEGFGVRLTPRLGPMASSWVPRTGSWPSTPRTTLPIFAVTALTASTFA